MYGDGWTYHERLQCAFEGVVIYTGKLGSSRFQNDVKEVQNGFECGMTIENFNDIKEGDLIEAYEEPTG